MSQALELEVVAGGGAIVNEDGRAADGGGARLDLEKLTAVAERLAAKESELGERS